MKKNYQLFPALIVLLIGIVISIGLHFIIKENFQNEKNRQFTKAVTLKTNAVRQELTNTYSSIEILQYFFEMNTTISREEFKNYTESILTINPGIRAISWVPKIEETQRINFNSKIQKENINFFIKELNEKNEFTFATERAFYFPVEYIEPLEYNKSAIGYDIFSNKKREVTITEAVKNRKLQLTPQIKLVQDSTEISVLGILPVYDYTKPSKDSLNFTNVKGLISAVYSINDLIDSALKKNEEKNIEVQIFDITNGLNEILYSTGNSVDHIYNQNRVIEIGGRIWELKFTPNPVYFSLKGVYNYLFAGLLVSILGSLFIIYFQSRKRKSEKLHLQLKEEEKARELSEKYQANILKTAMDGFLMLDVNGKLLEVNDTYSEMTGYNKTELLKMTIFDVDTKRTKQEIKENLQKIIELKEDRFETIHRRKDGSFINLEMSVQYQPSEIGFIIVFLKDITERKKTELELKQYRDNLEMLVKKRTQEIEEKNEKLDRINKLFIGRELRMKQLKEEIEFLKESGRF